MGFLHPNSLLLLPLHQTPSLPDDSLFFRAGLIHFIFLLSCQLFYQLHQAWSLTQAPQILKDLLILGRQSSRSRGGSHASLMSPFLLLHCLEQGCHPWGKGLRRTSPRRTSSLLMVNPNRMMGWGSWRRKGGKEGSMRQWGSSRRLLHNLV